MKNNLIYDLLGIFVRACKSKIYAVYGFLPEHTTWLVANHWSAKLLNTHLIIDDEYLTDSHH